MTTSKNDGDGRLAVEIGGKAASIGELGFTHHQEWIREVRDKVHLLVPMRKFLFLLVPEWRIVMMGATARLLHDTSIFNV